MKFSIPLPFQMSYIPIVSDAKAIYFSLGVKTTLFIEHVWPVRVFISYPLIFFRFLW